MSRLPPPRPSAPVAARPLLPGAGDPAAPVLVAVVAALAAGDGIIAALWLGGQARIAGTALVLTCAALALAMAGYAAGRGTRPCCQSPVLPPPAAMPPGSGQASGPAGWAARRPSWLEDTVDFDPDVLAWERELREWPPPPPRRPGRPGDGPAPEADGT